MNKVTLLFLLLMVSLKSAGQQGVEQTQAGSTPQAPGPGDYCPRDSVVKYDKYTDTRTTVTLSEELTLGGEYRTCCYHDEIIRNVSLFDHPDQGSIFFESVYENPQDLSGYDVTRTNRIIKTEMPDSLRKSQENICGHKSYKEVGLVARGAYVLPEEDYCQGTYDEICIAAVEKAANAIWYKIADAAKSCSGERSMFESEFRQGFLTKPYSKYAFSQLKYQQSWEQYRKESTREEWGPVISSPADGPTRYSASSCSMGWEPGPFPTWCLHSAVSYLTKSYSCTERY